jgi:hypothetical protein
MSPQVPIECVLFKKSVKRKNKKEREAQQLADMKSPGPYRMCSLLKNLQK